ncbi:MAG TPA: helix-turn-helix transcriptional regulator [Myxococcota bacterium]|nr:helix-turn-helix transcriptional regulator [Myxococcota bacterium]
MMAKTVGETLKYLRIKNHLTQRKLASIIGVDAGFISHVETGRRDAGYDTLQKWLAACGGRLVIFDAAEVPEGLPPEDARLVTAARALGPTDMKRVTELAEVLGRVDGLTRDLVRAQIDGPVNLLRKSDSSASEFVGERMAG